MCDERKPIPTHEEIQLAAYYLWKYETTDPGTTESTFHPSTEGPVYFWLTAESALLENCVVDAKQAADPNEPKPENEL